MSGLQFAFTMWMLAAVLLWLMFEYAMKGSPAPSRARKRFVRGGLLFMYAVMLSMMWFGSDIGPARPKPPKGPGLALSCWVSSPNDEVTIDFTGMLPAPKISASLRDGNAPFSMDCQYQFEIPKFGNEGI